MPILLYRVDERLIHGQVVVGWGARLRPDRYVVVDDALAESAWEQDLYRLALDDDVTATFVGVGEARASLETWAADERRTVLLTRDLDTMERLAAEGALSGVDVNLGGIHHARGREAVRPYLHLDAADRERIRRLTDRGARVTGRDLPDSARVPLDDLLPA